MNEADRSTDAELDATLRTSEMMIERSEHVMRQSEDWLQRYNKELGNFSNPEFVMAYREGLSEEARAALEREAQAMRDEIDRDLPKRRAVPIVRVKPFRVTV